MQFKQKKTANVAAYMGQIKKNIRWDGEKLKPFSCIFTFCLDNTSKIVHLYALRVDLYN